MTTRTVAGVIFDMDGVLIDSSDAHLQSWRQLAAEFGRQVTEEQFRSLPGVSRFLNERASHGRLDPDRRFSSGTTRGAKSEGPKPGAGFSNSGAGNKKKTVGPK